MTNDQRGAARGAVIQGRFIGGRFSLPGVTSPPLPVQPRMAGAQPIQPRMPQPNAAQSRAANPHINQHSAHLQRIAQAKMAQPRAAHHQAVQLRSAAPQGMVVQRHGNGEAFQLPANLSNFGGGGQPLPGAVRQKMESFFGTSFADVRVHVGPQASSIGALAFTQGSNLYFAQGQYNPNTPQGQQILGHELTHVVQQRAGRVRNPFASGVAVVQDRAMEAEADQMGLRAASHKMPVQPKLKRSLQETKAISVAQRQAAPSSAPKTGFAATAAPLGGRPKTIQRLSLLSYAPVHNRPGTDVIAGWHHARVAMTGTETQLAALYSGYNNPGTAPGFCKHYVAYDMVKTAVFNQLNGMTISAAVAWLTSRGMRGARQFTHPNGATYNLGAQPAPVIPNLGTALAPLYNEATLNSEVDDFIKNLANDPQNLYYRTNSSGDNGGTTLDIPQGWGNRTVGWENARLTNYRNYLIGLGLAV